jgi:ABC-type transport system involved in multi-copper enzyme maturation permease subunit
MDLRRLLRGKTLYILIGVLTSIVLSIVLMSPADTTVGELLGGAVSESPEMEFMGASMGVGAIYGLIGLIAMLFICNDYSSGFAKNIFSIHTSKWNYIVSKILTLMVASAIMIAAFIVEVFIFSLVSGRGIILENPLGLVAFLLQKLLVSGAFAAIYTFINVLTRNKAVGSVAAFLVGTGGLVMGLTLFFGMVGIDGSVITDSTIHGISTLPRLEFDFGTLARIILTGAVWTGVYAFFSNKVLQKRDVV